MAELPIRVFSRYFRQLEDQYLLFKCIICTGIILLIASSLLQHTAFSYGKPVTFKTRLSLMQADSIVTAIVYMNDTFNAKPKPRLRGRSAVLRNLRAKAMHTQQDLRAYLRSQQLSGSIRTYRPFWIINAVLVEGKASAIRAMYNRSDVRIVKENYVFSVPETEIHHTGSAPGLSEWGIEKIHADRVWDTYGFRGKNIRIGHLDTGVDIHHPDLAGKVAAWAKIDPYGTILDSSEAYDSGYHGTHTAGIMVGGDAGGSAIGVVPEARLLSAMVVTRGVGTFAQVIAGLEWIIDPDGNPSTDDGADIINLSLGMTGINEDFIEPIDNLINADIFPAFSIGNSGQGTSSSPGNLPESYGVGAVDQNDEVGFFSSGNEVTWNVPPYVGVWIKPDIAAPGVNVKSSVPGGYAYLSGTSMASPFVAGSAALVRQANPNLTVTQIKTILSVTAQDRGEPGKDTFYGWGLIDVYAAVQLALTGDIPEELSEFNPDTHWSYIVSPKNGQSIWGNAVTVMARGTQKTSKVLFQYQSAELPEVSDWISISEDSSIPFSLYWDVTGITPGAYRLRTLTYGDSSSSPVETSWISVTVQQFNPDIYEEGGSIVNPLSAHTKTEKISSAYSSEIIVADGTMIIIPSNTTSDDTEITIRHYMPEEIASILPPQESSLKSIGIFREFAFTNGENVFPHDITVFFPYMDENNDGYIDGTNIHENNLRIYYLKEDMQNIPVRWEELSIEKHITSYNSPDEAYASLEKGIYFKTDHFTLFAIMAEVQKDSLHEIIVYPNPARPSKNAANKMITFSNLTQDVRLQIFSLSGRLVREVNSIQSSYDWDLSNDAGEQVQSGVYFYLATDNGSGNKAKGKIAIIR